MSFIRFPISSFYAAILLCSSSLYAADEPGTESAGGEDAGFKGSFELGFDSASGNSERFSLTGAMNLAFKNLPWTYNFNANTAVAEEGDERVEENYLADFQIEYAVSNSENYWFGYTSLEKNEFRGIEQRLVEVLGYGATLLKTPGTLLQSDIGIGLRQSSYTDKARGDEDETIGYLGLHYNQEITDNTSFIQHLTFIPGTENDFLLSNSALEVKMSEQTAINLSYVVARNSKVSEGVEKTDTSTNVSFVYNF